MLKMNYTKELNIAKKTAINAGKKILEFYDKEYSISEKNDNGYKSPLTQADLAANEIIVSELRETFPDYSVLSEEEKDDKKRLDNDYVWIIDPIDGTKEFINKNGEFTVNIALVHKKKPVVGVIYVPVKDELYYAHEGGGAFSEINGVNKKIFSSKTKDINEMILAISRSHSGEREDKIKKMFKEFISRGSSLKGCMVACGDADAYFRFGNTSEWDICAMNMILDEAGAKITTLEGDEISYNNENVLINGFIVSNGMIHDKIIEVLKDD